MARMDADDVGGRQEVLVVDDEPMVREVLVTYLRRDGFAVREAADGHEARAALRAAPPDLILLDVMLPGVNGLDLLHEVRAAGGAPVILITARGGEDQRVDGLDLGADDYVTKPFSAREVAARVRSVLRRTAAPAPGARAPIRFGTVDVDPASREVRRDGAPVELTPKEHDLLVHLCRHPRQAFSRADLLEQVWSSSPEWQDAATVTVHVRRLRQKLEADPAAPHHLVTVYGVGYRFDP